MIWRLSPRADPRFVGRWEIYNRSNPGSQLVGIMELQSNGRGRTTFTDGSGSADFLWQVEGEAFLSEAADGPLWETVFRHLFARLWMKLSGTPYMRGVHELQIDRVEENEIRLRSDDGAEVVYRRASQPQSP